MSILGVVVNIEIVGYTHSYSGVSSSRWCTTLFDASSKLGSRSTDDEGSEFIGSEG